MDYFKLLQYFCIKHRVVLSKKIILMLRQGLDEEQYKNIEAICEDNALLVNKSPSIDSKILWEISQNQLQQLEALGYTKEEAIQALPACLQNTTFPSLRSLAAKVVLSKVDREEFVILPKEMKEFLERKEQIIFPASERLICEMRDLVGFIKNEKIATFSNKQLAYIAAYGSKKDIFKAFQVDIDNFQDGKVTINKRNNADYRVLLVHWIAAHGNFINLECLKQFAGADFHILDSKNESLWHFAVKYCDSDSLQKLIEKKFLDLTQINIANRRKETPLHFAFRADRVQISKELILQGANIYAKDNRGVSPIDILQNKAHGKKAKCYQILMDIEFLRREMRIETFLLISNPDLINRFQLWSMVPGVLVLLLASALFWVVLIAALGGAISFSWFGILLGSAFALGLVGMGIAALGLGLCVAVGRVRVKYFESILEAIKSIGSAISSCWSSLIHCCSSKGSEYVIVDDNLRLLDKKGLIELSVYAVNKNGSEEKCDEDEKLLKKKEKGKAKIPDNELENEEIPGAGVGMNMASA